MIRATFLFLLLFFGVSGVTFARTSSPLLCTERNTTTCTSKDATIAYASLQSTATSRCVLFGNTDAGGYGDWLARFDSYTVGNAGTPDEYITAWYSDVAPNGAVVSCGGVSYYWKPKECNTSDPPLTGGYMKYSGSEPGYLTCVDSCQYANPSSSTYQAGTVDGINYVSVAGWIPLGGNCTASQDDAYTPPPDSDHDGISDGNDSAPNNPGQSDNDPSKPGGDHNGDGDGSGNGNTSTGGFNCQSPPSSNGDQIAAQIAYQTWATRCAVESLKDANGNVRTDAGQSSSSGGGTGDPQDGGQSQTCEAGAVNAALCATRDYLKTVKDFFTGIVSEAPTLDNSPGDLQAPDTIWNPLPTTADLDQGGFGLSRTCPTPPEFMGYSLDPDGNLCMLVSLIGAIVLIAGYCQAAYIVGRS